jgi:hypothetical protein
MQNQRRHGLRYLCFLSLLSSATQAQRPTARAQPNQLSTATIAARARPATVTVFALGASGDTLAQGSGFILRPNGVVVTNYHVIAGASRATVVLPSGEQYGADLALAADPELDLVLLKVPGFDLPTLTATSAIPPVGSRVVAIGSPLGLRETVSEGIVSGVRLSEGHQYIQTTAAISPGSSGGPLLDTQGRVFAVSTFRIEDGQQLNFAVPVKYALGLIDATAVPRHLTEVSGAPQTPRPRDAAPGGRRTAWPPRPARSPRASLSGTWTFSELYYRFGNPEPLELQGLILAASEQTGLVVLGSAGGGDRSTYYLQALLASPDGRVSLTYATQSLDGYQIDDGFFVSGTDTKSRTRSEVVARDTALPLSTPTGLYQVEGRLTYVSGDYRSDGDRWWGPAAVAVVGDTAWVDIELHNDQGGSSGGPLRGWLDSQGLRAWTSDGRFRINGTLVGGLLTMSVEDQRDNGARFQGTVSGRKR